MNAAKVKQKPKAKVAPPPPPPKVIGSLSEIPIATSAGKLQGNAVVSFYILGKIGVDLGSVKSGQWSMIWDALFRLREAAPLMPKDIDAIIDNKYKPPKGAKEAYEALSTVIDELYSEYAPEEK